MDINQNNNDNELKYIFNENEFDININSDISDFDPHVFVKKYRNVTTIDNLKSELQLYRDHLNNQVREVSLIVTFCDFCNFYKSRNLICTIYMYFYLNN